MPRSRAVPTAAGFGGWGVRETEKAESTKEGVFFLFGFSSPLTLVPLVYYNHAPTSAFNKYSQNPLKPDRWVRHLRHVRHAPKAWGLPPW